MLLKANKESETGITIHYVNENYDEGAIVFQKKVVLTENNSVAQIAAKVHELEYRYFPEIIAQLLEEVPNEV
jgi:phosphoribosylglycinamide formyltransferase-1